MFRTWSLGVLKLCCASLFVHTQNKLFWSPCLIWRQSVMTFVPSGCQWHLENLNIDWLSRHKHFVHSVHSPPVCGASIHSHAGALITFPSGERQLTDVRQIVVKVQYTKSGTPVQSGIWLNIKPGNFYTSPTLEWNVFWDNKITVLVKGVWWIWQQQ